MRWRKSILAVLLAGVLLVGSGCSRKVDELPECPVPLVQVNLDSYPLEYTNNDREYVEFTLEIPENWDIYSSDYVECWAIPSDSDNLDLDDDVFYRTVRIEVQRYLEPGTTLNDLDPEYQNFYQNLFAGDTEKVKEFLNQDIVRAEEIDQWFGYDEQETNFDFQEAQHPDDGQRISWIECNVYQRSYGRLATVDYIFTTKGVTYHILYCYREDIPYMVTAGYNDVLEVSGGDFAIQTADSLRVKEHFIIK